MIVLSAGMQKSGTAWYFNLTNDLLVAAGYQDVRAIREKFRLHAILKDYNCNIGNPTPSKLARVAIPHFCRNTFVVKTHHGPTTSLLYLMSLGIVKTTYIYRDPRDVVVSGFEHGQRIRAKGENHTFAKWDSIETSILNVKRLLATWDKWMQCSKSLITRYEDLWADPINELKRLRGFLSLDVSSEELHRIVPNYQTDQLDATATSYLHFNKAAIGRFREVMSQRQIDLCRVHFMRVRIRG